MLCQNCHKNVATARYAEVVDGHVQERNLCPACLAQQHERETAGFEFSRPGAVDRSQTPRRVVKEAVRKYRACPHCGAPLERLLDARTAGCAECYSAFAEHFDPLLLIQHGSVHHKGKIPRLDDARERLRADLQVKRSLLRSVLQSENYEEAAILRDEIRGLEAGLAASESGTD